MIWQYLLIGWGLGLSTGSLCLVTCTPIYLPYLLSEDNSVAKTFVKILEISAGRFFAYLAFGDLAGYLGSYLDGHVRNIFTASAYILLSVFLIMTALRTHKHHKKCHIPTVTKITSSPFLLGVLTGINFCPAFLIALSSAIKTAGAMQGMLVFTGFFAGTSIYLLPIGFLGYFTKMNLVKTIARIATIAAALWFSYMGISSLLGYGDISHDHAHDHSTEITKIRRVKALESNNFVIVCHEKNRFYYNIVRDSLTAIAPTKYYFANQINPDSLASWQNSLLIVDNDIEIEKLPIDTIILTRWMDTGIFLNILRQQIFETEDYLYLHHDKLNKLPDFDPTKVYDPDHGLIFGR